MKPILQILLTVALLLSANPVLASAPFKIGVYDNGGPFARDVYKQVTADGVNLYYIEIENSQAKDNKTWLSTFLVVEDKNVNLLFQHLREMKELLHNCIAEEGPIAVYECPFKDYAKFIQTDPDRKFSDFNSQPVYEFTDYKCNLVCFDRGEKGKETALYMHKRKKKAPGPQSAQLSFITPDSLIDLICKDEQTPNSGMLKAENTVNLGNWRSGCNVYQFRTKGGSLRYYVQTSDLSTQVKGHDDKNFSDYVWFKDSELSAVIGFLKSLSSKWDYYSANHVYQKNSEYDHNGMLNLNAIEIDIVISPEISGFTGNIYGDAQIEKLLNFTGLRAITYYQEKTGEKYICIFLNYQDDEGHPDMYVIRTNGEELKSLISILEKAKQTN